MSLIIEIFLYVFIDKVLAWLMLLPQLLFTQELSLRWATGMTVLPQWSSVSATETGSRNGVTGLAMLPTVHSCVQVCIHQTDQSLKEAGVFGLAGILKHSKRMVVLWSLRYFSRLWCVYEALPGSTHTNYV